MATRVSARRLEAPTESLAYELSYVTASRGGFLLRRRTRLCRTGHAADDDHRGGGRRGRAEQSGAAVRTGQRLDRRSRADHRPPAPEPGAVGKRRKPRPARDRVRRGERGWAAAVLRP